MRGRRGEECGGLIGARNAGEVALVLIVGEILEDLVAPDRSSGRSAPLSASIGRLIGHADVLPLRVQFSKGGEGVGGSPCCIAIVERRLAVQPIEGQERLTPVITSEHAIITDRAHIPDAVKRDLEIIIGKYVGG